MRNLTLETATLNVLFAANCFTCLNPSLLRLMSCVNHSLVLLRQLVAFVMNSTCLAIVGGMLVNGPFGPVVIPYPCWPVPAVGGDWNDSRSLIHKYNT